MFFVRTASAGDLAAIRALLIETWHASYDSIYGPGKVEEITGRWHSMAALKANLERPASEMIVADDGSRIGGVAYASVTAKDVVTLHQLYVRPDCQRNGVGGDLFAEIETCFDGARLLRLEVETQNVGAVAFYRRHGMQVVGAAADCGDAGSGIAATVMEKPLPYRAERL